MVKILIYIFNFRQLTERFKIDCVPKLVIVTINGDIVTTRGRKEVQDRGIIAYRSWMSASGINEIKTSSILDDLPTRVQTTRDGAMLVLPDINTTVSSDRRSVPSTIAQTFTTQDGITDYSASEKGGLLSTITDSS